MRKVDLLNPEYIRSDVVSVVIAKSTITTNRRVNNRPGLHPYVLASPTC